MWQDTKRSEEIVFTPPIFIKYGILICKCFEISSLRCFIVQVRN